MSAINDGSGNLRLVRNLPNINPKEQDLLNKIAESSVDSSKQLLEQLFSATDDLFYELSERASTNNEENLYFEAMREIRVKKKRLIENFLDAFVNNFAKIPELSLRSHEERESGDEQELSIVDREELEIRLAQKNMASRTRDVYKTELYELEIRLNALLSHCEVSKDSNPLDPILLAHSFVSTCSKLLQMEIKTRLILFKLFEKHYLKQLGHIYAEANQTLINAGILPKVPRQHVNEQNPDAPQSGPTSAIESQAQHRGLPFESFDGEKRRYQPFQLEANTLASLMASIRAAQQANLPGLQALGNYQFYSANPGPVMYSPELTTILTDSQRKVDATIATEAPQNLLPQIISNILALKNPEEPQALEQPDEDIINLVALFFDKVLEDENLPLAVQSLICRLQIPILKVALHDKTFLTNEKHPVRVLINAITEAGLSFDESKALDKDPVYLVMVDGIHRINHQFKLDDGVFEQVTLELAAAMQAEQQKSSVVETRTNQTESGKAKLKAARSFAQAALFDKLKDVALPHEISQFLTNTWLQVMIITYIRSGKEGAAWVENEQLISDLVWACQHHSDEKSMARKQRLLPLVLQRIESGLEQVVDSESVRKSKVEEIAKILNATVEKAPDIKYESLSEEQKSVLGKADPSKKSWEEMTALERQQARFEELSSKYYLEAKHMPTGTWLQYTLEEKSKILRCKLSAKLDADNYIFVNRFGFKVTVKTRREFAYDMQFKKALPLDSTPIFERIMDRVVTQIRSLTQDL